MLKFPSAEADALLAQGYISEGLVIRVSTGPGENLKAIYQMVSTKAHQDFLLTNSTEERDRALSLYSYASASEAFYCSSLFGPTRPGLLRLSKAPFRRYAVSAQERATLEAEGWTFELELCRGEPAP